MRLPRVFRLARRQAAAGMSAPDLPGRPRAGGEPPAELSPCEVFGPGFASVTWEQYYRHFEVTPETEADWEAEAAAERNWLEARAGLRPAPPEAGADDGPGPCEELGQTAQPQAERELEGG